MGVALGGTGVGVGLGTAVGEGSSVAGGRVGASVAGWQAQRRAINRKGGKYRITMNPNHIKGYRTGITKPGQWCCPGPGVEMAGIEPASERIDPRKSTSVACRRWSPQGSRRAGNPAAICWS